MLVMLRRLALAYPKAAALLIAFALAAKLLVPVGFMPMMSAEGVTLMICNGAAPQKQEVSSHGGHHAQHEEEAPPAKSDPQCAFSGLSVPVIAAVDAVLLSAAILFILTTGFNATHLPARCKALYLRPPLRGPPLPA